MNPPPRAPDFTRFIRIGDRACRMRIFRLSGAVSLPAAPPHLPMIPLLLLRLFEMVARHGLPLSREAEKLVKSELVRSGADGIRPPQLWQNFGRILVQPYAAEALRNMHRLGLLTRLFPEFRAIDSLVIRDFYHRYTVDEHSFMTLENLHRLLREKQPAAQGTKPAALRTWERKFGEILSELEQPELLYFTLLFHDVGKGMPEFDSHVQGSLQRWNEFRRAWSFRKRLGKRFSSLSPVIWKCRQPSQRRDVFDPETVRRFAKIVGTMERLKMLCLLTYADICAVNPEALTPWKAELLWQLYAATANYLTRSVDDERLRIAVTSSEEMEEILAVLGTSASAEDLHSFLEGFPRRYTATHTPEQIAGHFGLARRLGDKPIGVELEPRERSF